MESSNEQLFAGIAIFLLVDLVRIIVGIGGVFLDVSAAGEIDRSRRACLRLHLFLLHLLLRLLSCSYRVDVWILLNLLIIHACTSQLSTYFYYLKMQQKILYYSTSSALHS